MEQHGEPELQAFARNLHKEESAVQAGLTLAWSNGPTEGFIHRLKLLKRQAYGRAGVALLKQRMLFHPSDPTFRLTLMTNRPISEKTQDHGLSSEVSSFCSSFTPMASAESPRFLVDRGDSAEFLGQPDEKSFRSADVAEPIRVFVLDHFAADKLCAVLAEPDERIVDVVHGKHDA